MVTDRQSTLAQSLHHLGSTRRKADIAADTSTGNVHQSSAHIRTTTATTSPPKPHAKRDWNDRGWLRIHCGPYRPRIDCDEPSRMVNIAAKATASEVAAGELGLPSEYALWLQLGGNAATARPLRPSEHPLLVQETIVQRLGWMDASRRARLAIDPQLRHLVRFFVGPAAATCILDANVSVPVAQRSGTVELLKGLVSPQWRRRAVALVGSLLLVYPGGGAGQPEVLDLAQCEISEHAAGYNRLILKIGPTPKRQKCVGCIDDDDANISSMSCAKSLDNFDQESEMTTGSSSSAQNSGSTWSLGGTSGGGGGGDRDKVLFIGFAESWERDMWSAWLIEASNHTTMIYANDNDDNDDTSPAAITSTAIGARCIDIGGSGLQAIPDAVLKSMQHATELRAGHNQLQTIGLRTVAELRRLRVLRLPGNGFVEFPGPLLAMQDLRVLDVGSNAIAALPADVWRLESLVELLIERNGLRELPETVGRLKQLRTLNAAHNRLTRLPAFLQPRIGNGNGNMRKPSTTTTATAAAANSSSSMQMLPEDQADHLNPPLTKVNLRSNQLRGSIILGNYGYLTQLDVSENDIEILDLSALDQLETLQCSRNKIKEITLNGRVLRSLVAGNNDLCKISVSPAPAVLTHLDLCHNRFVALPDWVSQCAQLHTLFASHNQITRLPLDLFSAPHSQLQSVHLDYNQIRTLPAMSVRMHHHHQHSTTLPLHQLHLHNNHLESLPDDLFAACPLLITLNVSSNRLQSLPSISVSPTSHANDPPHRLERLYITSNLLCDNAYDTLASLPNLCTLHAAYNRLNIFPDLCARFWPRLEELCLSGNNLLYLPDTMALLQRLRTLRVHSNRLQTVPALGKVHTLRTLDLAHNQLDRVDFAALVPRRLTALDLSCNQQLQVDARQLQQCRAQRAMSLVDVSGRNRVSLPVVVQQKQNDIQQIPTVTSIPTTPYQDSSADHSPPWRLGFSETAGTAAGGRLFVSQLRLPGFCNSEGLFGLFDGEASRMQPAKLVTAIPKLLLEERTVKETAASYMRYTLLAAHRELREEGQQQGACALLCHVSVAQQQQVGEVAANQANAADLPPSRCRFVLRCASVGQAQAILIRRHGHVQLTPTPLNLAAPPDRQLGQSASYPEVLPDPEVCEIALNEADEFLVLGNRRLWSVLTPAVVVREIRAAESNVQLAAKRLQDVAQAYGVAENLSVIIVKFENLAAGGDLMMRELRSRLAGQQQQVQKSAMVAMQVGAGAGAGAGGGEAGNGGIVSAGFCRCGCCCESNNNCCHSAGVAASSLQFVRHSSQRSHTTNGGQLHGGGDDDRSSPSGQSDITDMSHQGAQSGYLRKMSCSDGLPNGRRSSAQISAHERRSLRNCAGIVRAVRARIEEESEPPTSASASAAAAAGESDSALSEEQFKCWEYMLEQNTQLLFDKELNTISKGLTAGKQRSSALHNNGANPGPLLPLKSLSLSSPQLARADETDGSNAAMNSAAVAAGVAEEHRPPPHVAQYHASTPFLNRQFGSSRSFHPMPLPAVSTAANLFKSLAGSRMMAGCGVGGGAAAGGGGLTARPLGGPNAAYFGSLQRLMPYNLEYDFAAMRERMAVDESMEYDHRLQQYWGVATTEL